MLFIGRKRVHGVGEGENNSLEKGRWDRKLGTSQKNGRRGVDSTVKELEFREKELQVHVDKYKST